MRLREVTVTGRIPDGAIRATAEEAVLRHRPRRLLAGEVRVHEIVLRRPDVEIVWDALVDASTLPPGGGAGGGAGAAAAGDPVAGEAAAEATEASRWDLALRIDRVALEDARLVMREDGVPGEMVRFEGLDVELRDVDLPPGAASPLLALTATGEVRADRLVTAALVSEEPTGDLRLADGHVLVSDLALPSAYGPLAVESLDLDLTRDPYVYSLAGGGAPLATAELLGAASGFGDAALTFTFDGDGSEDGALRGGGRLEVAEGTLGALPLLEAIEALLAGTDLVGRPYEPFTVPFALAGDLLTVEPFAVDAGNLRLAGRGTVDLTGPLDFRVELAMPREDLEVKEIPREVIEALTDVDGRVKLPILVAGTLEAPRATFDRAAWSGLVGRRLVDEGVRQLGRLLAGDGDGG